MFPLLKRHAIQVLVAAGRMPQAEIARFVGVDERTVRRVAKEAPVTEVDIVAPPPSRIGRPSKAEPYRQFVADVFAAEPRLLSVEILRRARLAGYGGGKSALYEVIASLRPREVAVEMRFEGLPGEFSQHDFGQVDVAFSDRSTRRVHFFASRLKWSRWAEVTIVPDQTAETLIRTLADHFVAMGGVPLCAVFDRPKTVALKWKKNGEVVEWNPIFAYAALEIGFTAEVCWPYQPRQKGAVESLVGWVKGSFFKQRRFHALEDLVAQLTAARDQHHAAESAHRSDPGGADRRGARAAAGAAGPARGTRAAYPRLRGPHRRGRPRGAQLLDAAGGGRPSRHALPLPRRGAHRGGTARSAP
jgi:transposase